MQGINRAALLGAVALLTPAAADPGKPPLSAQTATTGGPLDPDQQKLIFDTADLAFEIFPEREAIAGVATLGFTAKAPVRRLVIDLDRNLPVSAVAIDEVALPRSAWRNPQGRMTIDLPRQVAAGGKVSARISYAGTPHVAVRAPWDGGFVWAKTPSGKPWVATAIQGEGCDLFWPCIDYPTYEPKRIDLHITVPPGLGAPSNGVLTGIDTLPDGRSRWNWSVANPTIHSVALNVGPYRELKAVHTSRFGNQIPMHFWYLEGNEAKARGLFAEFAPTLDFYEAMVGPYPFAAEKMGVVETPHLGMEHQTINAYGNGYKQAPEGFDWLLHHEFGHEWFANQMTVANWDDFWLHEAYTQYMQPLYGRAREGEGRYLAMMRAGRARFENLHPIVSGSARAANLVSDEATGPGSDIYFKGAWMLHTLRGLIGDAKFGEIMRRVVYGRPDPAPGNFTSRFATTAEYRAIVNDVAGHDLGWFFDVYLGQAALPELVETRTPGRLALAWKVPGGGDFPLPVEVSVAGRMKTLAMAEGHGSIAVPAGAQVIVDPQSRVLRKLPGDGGS
ncbi:M1 family metallopeptidase [Sphingomonas qomolangmaensis]|uniref:M1 family metallopeptidase n=1 Tax=Sphingomonas qomolangmaensis TaxID=2918765 RepID=A0ABY5L8A1_9SPHN|nr:M1 family metallopeptidase [Sphingomonas qomolangmaensis]UUL83214.1 M1 family metallopeptidase [Sphingomonas qomolangmaensis]